MDAPATRFRIPRLAVPRRDRDVLLALAVATVLLRLPFLAVPLGIDEGGYAYVASRWIESTGSLYGDQWVDRPPLLLVMYAAAELLGGDATLRVFGAVAAVVTVVASAGAAGRIAGPAALRWSGLVAVTLTSSVLLQGQTVNAELPAIALTATAVWLTTVAATSSRGRAAWHAALAGVSGASAMLVKQSFADGLAFALCFAIALVFVGGRTQRPRAMRILAGACIGFAVTAGLVAAWASTAGPGLTELLDAVYSFRLEAGRTIRERPGPAGDRAYQLLLVAIASGVLALAGFVLVGLVRLARGSAGVRAGTDARLVRAAAGGLAGMGVVGLVGVLGGGNWWTHYLLQLVPMVAVGTGIVVAAAPRSPHRARIARHAEAWTIIAVAIAAASWVVAVGISARGDYQRRPATVGDWLSVAARPDDTAFITWGRANVLQRSGLRSPYPMSWSLPIRVRDPELRQLRAVLAGEDAPTWLVRWNALNSWGIDADGSLRSLIRERYELAETVCGVRILHLRDAPARAQLPPAPADGDCASDSAAVAWLLERLR